MARFPLLAAFASLLVLAGGGSGSALGAHAANSGGCKSARSSDFSGSECAPGKYHSGPGRARNVLFYKAKNGHCRDAKLAPRSHNVARVRAATLCLINRERAAHGEAPLHWNLHLLAAAQVHTESMAFGDYFEHIGPHGQTPLMRLRKTG